MAVVAMVAVSVVISLIEETIFMDRLIDQRGVGSMPSIKMVSKILAMVNPFTHLSLACGSSRKVLGIKTNKARCIPYSAGKNRRLLVPI